VLYRFAFRSLTVADVTDMKLVAEASDVIYILNAQQSSISQNTIGYNTIKYDFVNAR